MAPTGIGQGPDNPREEIAAWHSELADNGKDKGKARDRRHSDTGEGSSRVPVHHSRLPPRPSSSQHLNPPHLGLEYSTPPSSTELSSPSPENSEAGSSPPGSPRDGSRKERSRLGKSRSESSQNVSRQPSNRHSAHRPPVYDQETYNKQVNNQPAASQPVSSQPVSSPQVKSPQVKPQREKIPPQISQRTSSNQPSSTAEPSRAYRYANRKQRIAEGYSSSEIEAVEAYHRPRNVKVANSDTEASEQETTRREKAQIQSTVRALLDDPSIATGRKVRRVTELVARKVVAERDAKALAKTLEEELRKTAKDVSNLQRHVDESWNDVLNREEKIKALEGKLRESEAENRRTRHTTTTTAAEADTHQTELRERLQALHSREKELKESLSERDEMVLGLQQSIGAANQAIEHYQAQLARAEKDSTGWGESIEGYILFLSRENIKLRQNLIRVNDYMAGNRNADASRFDEILHEPRLLLPASQQQQQLPTVPPRLTSGTLDRIMDDAFTEDVPCSTRPAQYKSPAMVKVRRRLARTKHRARRAGSESPDAARPTDIKKRHREQRAASTYLQYKNKQNEMDDSVLHTKGRHTGLLKMYPRKRTRLSNAEEMTKRMEAATDAARLPILRLGDLARFRPRVGITAYDRRNDAALAEMMKNVTVSEKGQAWVGLDPDPSEVALVSIARTVVPFLPRISMFQGPRRAPTPISLPSLSRDERRHWAKLAKKWTLGPDAGSKKKKNQVRFADNIDYEPDQADPEWTPEEFRPLGYRTRWSTVMNILAVIIRVLLVVLLLLLVWTILQFIVSLVFEQSIPGAWIDANELPHDIASQIRKAGAGNGRPRIMEFEAARWSDVDAAIFG
ncbi:hypothetical protein BDV12DRAFT_194494 [Aspergillus spectabilis]